MIANGSVFKFGDNIDTDVIIPARYLNIADYKELATHCMEDIDDKFISKVKKGDIIVATKNFGCGSSREHAPIVIKESGVSCVIASTFARIFFRNSINIGLPILECEEAANNIEEGDKIEVDFSTGVIKNITKGKEYKAEPFPEFMQNIILNEGLINSIKANRG
ncbi:3-isopropylmalate dehydratase small subunit [Clostridioides difficile]|nr:3-isopropylmalate dehydratase small subunit [Clostridioides difficile]AVD35828.1 3-isopropylmalate dehydratase small subunit [Clostridioides difficile]AVD40724.1 3-isopropylmalate dehydratase small subunit [Clostridioides difficile]AVD44234.1 3-isopropylmalate dehydratase small subunit [Clostridioides difficile]AXU67331.1 3-isopropylmalate dehydratase small subunit [Clostridioides difficile]AXU89502.1 3-isopropylmalate dehydratase small subunit [Clostridioides difficile]